MRLKALLLALSLGLPGVVMAAPESALADANRLFAEGKFQEAAAKYHTALEQKPGSANGWYNLGNTDYRLGEKGKAALAYERALALDPAHAEARFNLAHLRSETNARVPEAPRWQQAVRAPEAWLGKRAVPWIAAGSLWGALFLLIPLFGRQRSPYWVSGITLGLVGLWTGGAVVLDHLQGPRWIITATGAQPRTAPMDSAKALGSRLPEGSVLTLLGDRGEWIYVKLPDANHAWLPRKEAEPVVPADGKNAGELAKTVVSR